MKRTARDCSVGTVGSNFWLTRAFEPEVVIEQTAEDPGAPRAFRRASTDGCWYSAGGKLAGLGICGWPGVVERA